MKSLTLLKIEAQVSCEYRGHNMVWDNPEGRYQTAECQYCGEWVRINSRSQPNEIDIGGPAVAVNCPES